MGWLWTSLLLSVALTIVLNVILRLLRGPGRRIDDRLDRWAREAARGQPGEGPPRVRVIIPWKAMLVGSVALTVLVNLVLLLT